MKVKLLGQGIYSYLDRVDFPQEVEATYLDYGYHVKGCELIRIGGDGEVYDKNFDYFFTDDLIQAVAE